MAEDDEDINISDDVNTCTTPTKHNVDITSQRRSSSTESRAGEASDLLFPIYEAEHHWNASVRAALYGTALMYIFIG